MHSIFSYWHFDFITSSFIILLCLAYLYAVNFDLKKQSVYFFSGIILLIISVASPLHFIGENYLFSAHMITHVLILLVATPLLVAGIPQKNNFENALKIFSKKMSKAPALSWLTGVGIMWLWHIPYIYNQLFTMPAMAHSAMHTMNLLSYIHMASLFFAGILFCWPIINPYSEFRISPLAGVLYLSTACVGCSLLGLLITFAPEGLYNHYTFINDEYGFLPVIRNDWGISTGIDQRAGGLIMWVPCCFIYLSAAMLLLKKWFDEKEQSPSVLIY